MWTRTGVVLTLAILMGLEVAIAQQVSQNDRDFMLAAARAGLAEVQLGELAASRASNDEVRRFGERMVGDHQAANRELSDLAQRKDVSLPTDLDERARGTRDRLAAMSGPDFDRAYIEEMVKDHERAVQLFEGEARNGQDAEVRAWATRTLPVVREHQRQADVLHGVIGAAPVSAMIRGTTVPGTWCAGGWHVSSGTNFGVCSR